MKKVLTIAILASATGVEAKADQLVSYVNAKSIEITRLENARSIDVSIGKARLLQLSGPAELVIIGDAQIADATLVNATLLLLNGKSTGSTNIIVLNSATEVLFEAVISVDQTGVRPVTVRNGANVNRYICRQLEGCTLVKGVEATSEVTTPNTEPKEN